MVRNALGWSPPGLEGYCSSKRAAAPRLPLSYDLGGDLRLVLMSVTEAGTKPPQYPTITTRPTLAVGKMDLAAAVRFDAYHRREA